MVEVLVFMSYVYFFYFLYVNWILFIRCDINFFEKYVFNLYKEIYKVILFYIWFYLYN